MPMIYILYQKKKSFIITIIRWLEGKKKKRLVGQPRQSYAFHLGLWLKRKNSVHLKIVLSGILSFEEMDKNLQRDWSFNKRFAAMLDQPNTNYKILLLESKALCLQNRQQCSFSYSSSFIFVGFLVAHENIYAMKVFWVAPVKTPWYICAMLRKTKSH